jgi:hypothetical protein
MIDASPVEIKKSSGQRKISAGDFDWRIIEMNARKQCGFGEFGRFGRFVKFFL